MYIPAGHLLVANAEGSNTDVLSISEVRDLFVKIKSTGRSDSFSRVYLPDNSDSLKRKTILLNGRKAIQAECESTDDDMKQLVALISDTGMRLSEANGLLIPDLALAGNVPYVFIKLHSWRPLQAVSRREHYGTSIALFC